MSLQGLLAKFYDVCSQTLGNSFESWGTNFKFNKFGADWLITMVIQFVLKLQLEMRNNVYTCISICILMTIGMTGAHQ